MLQTTFYLSVNRGGDSLTLDGNLSLFKELLTALNTTNRELLETGLTATSISLAGKSLQQAGRVKPGQEQRPA